MSYYTHTLTLTIPASLYDIACAIAQALDPDLGGAQSFGQHNPDVETYTTSTPCTAEFHTQAYAMLANPEMLHYAVSADYAARWKDQTPPTLDECTAFCAGVVMPHPNDQVT